MHDEKMENNFRGLVFLSHSVSLSNNSNDITVLHSNIMQGACGEKTTTTLTNRVI